MSQLVPANVKTIDIYETNHIGREFAHTVADRGRVRVLFRQTRNLKRNIDIYWLNFDGTEEYQDTMYAATQQQQQAAAKDHNNNNDEDNDNNENKNNDRYNYETVGSGRYCYSGHAFVLRYSDTQEWILTYRASDLHNDIVITVTEYGVCLQDLSDGIEERLNETDVLIEYEITHTHLETAELLRWGQSPDIVSIWEIYVNMLWRTKVIAAKGKIFNLMGEIFFNGAYNNVIDFERAWLYFTIAESLGNGDAMYNLGFMLEERLMANNIDNIINYYNNNVNTYNDNHNNINININSFDSYYGFNKQNNNHKLFLQTENAMLRYYCSSLVSQPSKASVRGNLILGWRNWNGIDLDFPKWRLKDKYKDLEHEIIRNRNRNTNRNKGKYVSIDARQIRCTAALPFYRKVADIAYRDVSLLDRHVYPIDLSEKYGTSTSAATTGTTNSDNFYLSDNEFNYYEQQARAGHVWANQYLGQMYLFGLRGHAPNYPAAMRYFEDAVAQGNDAVSMDYLGHMHQHGLGTTDGTPNITRAKEFFEAAANKNLTVSQVHLGYLLWTGFGANGKEDPAVVKNVTAAVYWFERAAEQNYNEAMYYLGLIYYNGKDGIEQNLTQSVYWYVLNVFVLCFCYLLFCCFSMSVSFCFKVYYIDTKKSMY